MSQSNAFKFTVSDQLIVRAGISELPLLERQILIYRFWGNCSIEEIAKAFQMSWAEVDQLIESSFKALKCFCLEDEEFTLSKI